MCREHYHLIITISLLPSPPLSSPLLPSPPLSSPLLPSPPLPPPSLPSSSLSSPSPPLSSPLLPPPPLSSPLLLSLSRPLCLCLTVRPAGSVHQWSGAQTVYRDKAGKRVSNLEAIMAEEKAKKSRVLAATRVGQGSGAEEAGGEAAG
ncbi:unnamed protein product [Closterium sp. NIES-64]|nr:unnamed protein product [Closterium sp. NIES-64]